MTSESVLATVHDPDGTPVDLTIERWSHITNGDPDEPVAEDGRTL